jgi:uncharacterized protein
MRSTATEQISIPRALRRIEEYDWARISEDLDERGYAQIGRLLSVDECKEVAAMYSDESSFRGRVVMWRHGFGRGEYKYFNYPLPGVVQELRIPNSSSDAITPGR